MRLVEAAGCAESTKKGTPSASLSGSSLPSNSIASLFLSTGSCLLRLGADIEGPDEELADEIERDGIAGLFGVRLRLGKRVGRVG
jgi:hypothetical protein